MEKTVNETREVFEKSINASTQWYNEQTANAFKTFGKQYEWGMDIFKQIIDNSFTPFKAQDIWQKYVEMFMKNIDMTGDWSKQLMHTNVMAINLEKGQNQVKVLGEDFIKTVMDTFDKQAKLTEQYNDKYMALLSTQLKGTNANFDEMSDKYKVMLKSNIEIVEESLKSILTNYSKETGKTAFQNNNQLIEEIDMLIDFMTGSARKFWEDMLKAVKKTPVQPATSNQKPVPSNQKLHK